VTVMTVAIPLDTDQTIYPNNPCTAPRFGIYLIEGVSTDIRFHLQSVVENPWCSVKGGEFGADQIACECDPDRRKNMRHISEHYALLDAIGGCSYLLAVRYCANTSHALQKGGIKVFKIPPIIDKIDNAIKNFLIGACFANKVQYIHHGA
jgi:predicted Fe-Mo cluster-binding NifX family protein